MFWISSNLELIQNICWIFWTLRIERLVCPCAAVQLVLVQRLAYITYFTYITGKTTPYLLIVGNDTVLISMWRGAGIMRCT